MGDVLSHAKGTVIHFPDPASRPVRTAIDGAERRGVILLFTGVRYERLSEPGPEPAPRVSDGARGRRRPR
jgi:hypothetical protein